MRVLNGQIFYTLLPLILQPENEVESLKYSFTDLLLCPIENTLPVLPDGPCSLKHLGKLTVGCPAIPFFKQLLGQVGCFRLVNLLIGFPDLQPLHSLQIKTG